MIKLMHLELNAKENESLSASAWHIRSLVPSLNDYGR